MSLTSVSLFSGIGGLDLAAERAGFTVTDAYERDPFCCRVLRSRFPHTRVHEGDIDDVTSLPNADVVFGGPPCQGWSNAGSGLGIKDPRNKWPEMLRLVAASRPRCVLVENVPGGIAKGFIDYVCQGLEAESYRPETLVYSASAVNAPHIRERVFILAYTERVGQSSAAAIPAATHHPQWHREASQCRGGAVGHAAQSGRALAVRQRRLPQPGLVRAADGLPGRLDFPGFPAYFGQDQHDYEPPRTVVSPGEHHRPRIQALGNAVVPAHALPLFIALARFLSEHP